MAEMRESNEKKLPTNEKCVTTQLNRDERILTESEVRKILKNKNISGIKLDVDVSQVLKGLKSVQREARKAIQALKELKLLQESCPLCCETDFEIVTMRATDGRIVSKTKRGNKCGWSND